MIRVITYGTFDLLHVGHLNLFERLRALGDELVVAVSTDAFNAEKGKSSVVPFEDRIRLVGALACVSATIAEHAWSQKAGDIGRLGIDVFGMGDDWRGRFDELDRLCRVVYLPRTEGVSTSALREAITRREPDRRVIV